MNNLSIILIGLSLFVFSVTESAAISPEECATQEQILNAEMKQCMDTSAVCTGNEQIDAHICNGLFEPCVHRVVSSGREFGCEQRTCDDTVKFTSRLYGLPAECGGSGRPDKASPSVDKPQSACGSMIQLDNQVVGESIPLVGVTFDLSYVSNRVIGRRGDYTIQTPIKKLIGSEITGYDITIWDDDPLAPLHQASYSGLSDIADRFVWQADDSPGSHRFFVKIIEKFPALTAQSNNVVEAGNLKAKVFGIGGWTPSVLQFYDTVSSTLYRGDGSARFVEARHINEQSCGASVCYDLQVAEEDGSRVYEFDAGGRHLRTRLGLTGSIEFTFGYDVQGTLLSITEPFQRITKFQRDDSGKLTAIMAPFGQITPVTLNADGYLTSVTNPKGDAYKMTYYGTGGLLKTFATPSQRVSTFTYDGDGNLLTDAHSGGRRATISSQSSVGSDLRKTLTTREGRVTSLASSFDSGGFFADAPTPDSGVYQRTTTYPSGLKATFTDRSSESVYSDDQVWFRSTFINDPRFGKMARLLSRTDGSLSFGQGFQQYKDYKHDIQLTDPQDPFSINQWTTTVSHEPSEWTTQYIGASRTYKRKSKLGRTSQIKIDALERPVLTKRGNLLPIVLRYTKDQLTQVSQGTRKTTLAYDSVSGLLSDITDPLNRTVSFDYDAAQRVTAQTLPDGRVIRFTYDKAGHLTSVTPPTRPQHRFAINAKDLLGAYTPPPLTAVPQIATAYSYNNDDQLTRILRPDGAEVALNYDAGTGLLETMTTPLGDYVLTHKAQSELVSDIKTPDDVLLSIGYWGKLPSSYSYFWINKVTYSRSFNQTTDLIDSDLVMIEPSAVEHIRYAYDDDESPKQIGDMGLGYNVPNGLLSTTTLGTFKDNYSYSGYGELSAYTSAKGKTKFFSLNFTRDNLGRITKKEQALADAGTQTYDYGYDEAGRLKDVRKNGATFASYVYDDNGNRISGNRNGVVFSADYDDQDRLERQNTLKFAYNANGDLIGKTNTSSGEVTLYIYDVFGNLRTVKLPNATVIDYEIDGLNRRIGKKVNGLLTVRYLYQDQLRIAAEVNPDGTLKRRYVYATGRTIPDYYIERNEKYKIISDYLGSPRAVVKLSTNKIVYRMDHDEFGRITLDSKPGFLPFGFAGGLYEPATGLVRFGARDYDPEIGRWTVKDPIRFAGGDSNLYGYVLGNPINFRDTRGLSGGIAIAAVPEYRTTRLIVADEHGNAIGYADEIPEGWTDKACPGQSSQGQDNQPPHEGWHPPMSLPETDEGRGENELAMPATIITGGAGSQ